MQKQNNTSTGLVFTAEVGTGASTLLGPGEHNVTIASVSLTDPTKRNRRKEEYAFANDPTPQLEVVFKNEEGQFTEWMNLRGYKRFDDLTENEKKSGKYISRNDFAVVKATGKRVVSEEKTATARSIVSKLGWACGMEPGTEFGVDDLVDRELTIIIGPSQDRADQLRVKAVKPIDELA